MDTETPIADPIVDSEVDSEKKIDSDTFEQSSAVTNRLSGLCTGLAVLSVLFVFALIGYVVYLFVRPEKDGLGPYRLSQYQVSLVMHLTTRLSHALCVPHKSAFCPLTRDSYVGGKQLYQPLQFL